MPAHRKSVAQHIEEGTFHSTRHKKWVKQAVEPLHEPPECPKSVISKKAKAAWAQIIPKLTESGRIAPEDLPSLELAFRSLGIAHALYDTVEGLDAVNDAAKLKSLSGVANQNAGLFSDIMGKFGITPKAREGLIQTLAMNQEAQKTDLAALITTEGEED